MTNEQKAEILRKQIRDAEDRAFNALTDGNEAGHRIHTDFAEACRNVLRTLVSA
jgi:hypothetical protein